VEVTGSGPPGPAVASPRSSSGCLAAIFCRAAALKASSSASSCADPMCSMLRDPRREDQTTCTAVAPDFVFTVRTYGTGPLYGPARQASGSPGNQPLRTGVTRTGTPPPGETARQLEAPPSRC
jgi:hypothetical protein